MNIPATVLRPTPLQECLVDRGDLDISQTPSFSVKHSNFTVILMNKKQKGPNLERLSLRKTKDEPPASKVPAPSSGDVDLQCHRPPVRLNLEPPDRGGCAAINEIGNSHLDRVVRRVT